jgi:hypothetical protein
MENPANHSNDPIVLVDKERVAAPTFDSLRKVSGTYVMFTRVPHGIAQSFFHTNKEIAKNFIKKRQEIQSTSKKA